jgi:hypothetical protein
MEHGSWREAASSRSALVSPRNNCRFLLEMSTQLYGMEAPEREIDRSQARTGSGPQARPPGLPGCRLSAALPDHWVRSRSEAARPGGAAAWTLEPFWCRTAYQGASPASAGDCGDAGSRLHVRRQGAAAQHRLVRPSGPGRLLHRSWMKNQGFPARSVRRPAGDRDLQPLRRAHAMQRPCPRARRARA